MGLPELKGPVMAGLIVLGGLAATVVTLVGREIYFAANPDKRPVKKPRRKKK